LIEGLERVVLWKKIVQASASFTLYFSSVGGKRKKTGGSSKELERSDDLLKDHANDIQTNDEHFDWRVREGKNQKRGGL